MHLMFLIFTGFTVGKPCSPRKYGIVQEVKPYASSKNGTEKGTEIRYTRQKESLKNKSFPCFVKWQSDTPVCTDQHKLGSQVYAQKGSKRNPITISFNASIPGDEDWLSSKNWKGHYRKKKRKIPEAAKLFFLIKN